MIASILGSCLSERAGQGTVLPARAVTFEGRRKAEEMPEGSLEDKAGAAVDLNKNENQ